MLKQQIQFFLFSAARVSHSGCVRVRCSTEQHKRQRHTFSAYIERTGMWMVVTNVGCCLSRVWHTLLDELNCERNVSNKFLCGSHMYIALALGAGPTRIGVNLHRFRNAFTPAHTFSYSYLSHLNIVWDAPVGNSAATSTHWNCCHCSFGKNKIFSTIILRIFVSVWEQFWAQKQMYWKKWTFMFVAHKENNPIKDGLKFFSVNLLEPFFAGWLDAICDTWMEWQARIHQPIFMCEGRKGGGGGWINWRRIPCASIQSSCLCTT